MRNTFTSLLLLLSGAASAQVTLNQSSYNNLQVSSDSFGRVINNFPVMDTGSNREWNFTEVTYDNPTYYSEQAMATNAAFPGASYYEPRGYTLGSAELKFTSKRWSGITTVGLERVGEEIARQAISLSVSGMANTVATDSLVVKAQNVIYSSSYPLVKFPAAKGASWTAKFDFVVDMELTYAHYGFVNTPMQYKVSTEYVFSCPGDGKAFIQYKNTPGVLGVDDVLMVRIGGTTVDSFYMNSMPAGATILTALGLLQGKTSNNHWDELFRDQEVNALVLYSYGPNVFTTPESAQIHQQRVPFPASVKSVSADGKMALFPNPAKAGGELFINLDKAAAGEYTYSISSISGANTAKGSVQVKGSRVAIALPPSINQGIYWLTLQHNGEVIGVAPFRCNE